MNVKELRIGNLVLDKDKEICNIEQIHSDKINHFCKVSGNTAIDIYPSNVYPIELTEEWLIKLGYKNKSNGYGYKNYTRPFSNNVSIYMMIIGKNKGKFYINGAYEDILIKHVHALQNIHFFTQGEELELKED